MQPIGLANSRISTDYAQKSPRSLDDTDLAMYSWKNLTLNSWRNIQNLIHSIKAAGRKYIPTITKIYHLFMYSTFITIRRLQVWDSNNIQP